MQPEIIVSPPASVAENLSIDEALTRSAASERRFVLRLWWGAAPTVVVGRSENADQVAYLDVCERLGVGVVRRFTGGGTVLQTPGVLNYSLTGPAPGLPDIRALFSLGATLLVRTLERLGVRAAPRGVSDVAVGELKISGNAMGRRWGGLLLHGTLLYDLDFDLVECCLRHPPREPDYRQRRSHRDFLTTLRLLDAASSPSDVEAAVMEAARELAAEGALDISPYVRE